MNKFSNWRETVTVQAFGNARGHTRQRTPSIFAMLAMGLMLVGLWATTPVLAQSGGSGGSLSFDSIVEGRNLPIDVTADTLELVQSEQKAMFRGNVEASQGVLMLRAQEIALYYNDDAKGDEQPVDQVEANGGVTMTTEKEKVTADKLVYKINEAKIYLLGNVVLARDGNTLKGDTLVIDLVTGYSRIEGSPQNGGRVRARFNPASIDD